MNLQERLQAEFIGENDITEFGDPLKHPTTASQQAFGRDKLRVAQRQAIPTLAATIAADLKGMLPEKKPAAASVYAPHYRDARQHDCDYTLQVQLNNEVNKGYNQALKDVQAAIDRYCSVNESKGKAK